MATALGESCTAALRQAGHRAVAGCDEAGRGPLAGPVVAAAVILAPGAELAGLDDSKKLTPAARERLYGQVRATAVTVGLGLASVAEIDRLNILRASLLAMRRAVEALVPAADFVLVDGNQRVPGLACGQQTVVGGDGRELAIAAASIVAKVTRDAIMARLDRLYPGYGFASHKGYGSGAHREALQRLGPSPVHRTSFAPVRALLDIPPPLPPARSRGASAVQLILPGNDDA